MAMDEARGIAYISTGGPKPNFIGVGHLGDNLFANCLIALDAQTAGGSGIFRKSRTTSGPGHPGSAQPGHDHTRQQTRGCGGGHDQKR
jgi:hypothetical protein